MKNPFRTEAEAFSFVLIVAALSLAVALAGILFGGREALFVFLALALGVALGVYMKSEPKVREPAIWERGRDDRKRLLVVANETVTGRALRNEVVHRAHGEDADVRPLGGGLDDLPGAYSVDGFALSTRAALAREEQRLVLLEVLFTRP